MKLPPVSPLLTDLYQLTMLHGYWAGKMEQTAVFEFFVRKLPAERNFLVAAGLEQALHYLEQLHFSPEELAWLRQSGQFPRQFIDYLAQLRFSGDVHAMAEGTIFFANEPILRITAPLPQAQLVESRLINILHFQTLIASKAARCVLAAPNKLLIDFGMRRAHGAEAAVLAARASYIAGFTGTATTLAGAVFDIPVFGTMAHSFIQAHASEEEAFLHFAHTRPDSVILLIDTYDTEAAATKVVALAPRLADAGIHIRGVRIDSGDLAAHARKVRSILDAGGLKDAIIFASGNIDEYALETLAHAPINGFGIGTRLDTSEDAPSLDCAYKLQEYAGTPRRKRSEGKATWPGRKQVYRRYDTANHMCEDVLTTTTDICDGEALLQAAMHNGQRLHAPEPLPDIRTRASIQLASLPLSLRGLTAAPGHPVIVSEALRDLAKQVDIRQ